jgi:dTDP-4-dehydrorhamnose 3,5-epimerase
MLSSDDHRQIMIPSGFAHGFLVTGRHALVSYRTSTHYDPSSEHTLRWDDATLHIDWPLTAPELSDKDAASRLLRDFPVHELPTV